VDLEAWLEYTCIVVNCDLDAPHRRVWALLSKRELGDGCAGHGVAFLTCAQWTPFVFWPSKATLSSNHSLCWDNC
jgi:hypothetical protein